MAKKGSKSRRRKGRLTVINIDMLVALVTTGSGATVRTAPTAGELFSRPMYVISSDLYVTLNNLTAGQGPIEVGWAHDDLSAAEITEGIVADTADRNDQIALERAGRKIRKIAMLSGVASEEVANNAQDIRTRIGFMVDTGSGLALYAHNRSGATWTTGGVVKVTGKIYARA